MKRVRRRYRSDGRRTEDSRQAGRMTPRGTAMSGDADQSGTDDGGDRSSTGAGSTAELRQDVVSGNFTLVNPARAGRPTTVARPAMARPDPAPVLARGDAPHTDRDCPFCWGNEQSTATELLRVGPGAPGSPGWRIRVVRNRYPVLGGTDEATGRCEVVVFRDHDRRLEDMEVDEVGEILDVVRSRLAAPALTARTSVQVFVNVEAVAGASIAHPHAQIIALDFVPQALALEFDTMARLGADPLQRDLELADEHDLVVSDGAITAWSPWGTTSPFAVRIAPRVPGPAFVDLDPGAVAAVARTLRDTLRDERPARAARLQRGGLLGPNEGHARAALATRGRAQGQLRRRVRDRDGCHHPRRRGPGDRRRTSALPRSRR